MRTRRPCGHYSNENAAPIVYSNELNAMCVLTQANGVFGEFYSNHMEYLHHDDSHDRKDQDVPLYTVNYVNRYQSANLSFDKE